MLEAEVVEINRDIDYCEQCLRKYGEWFNSPLQYLRELKRTKKNKMCACPSGVLCPATLCWLALVADARDLTPAHRAVCYVPQEGDHSHDGELQQQPSGRQEARQEP